MKRPRPSFRYVCMSLAACALLATGCQDKDFDLGEIDSLIGLGGDDLTLPSDNTTKDIMLDDVLELNNSNFIHIAEFDAMVMVSDDGTNVADELQ